MPKIRRGGYVFVTWMSDHGPRHVRVYRDSKFVVKRDLQNGVAMKGRASKKVLVVIKDLQSEGRL